MTLEKVGVGVIGCGTWANLMHLPAFQQIDKARVVAVASRSGKHARETANKFGVPHWYTDYRKLLDNPQVQVVDILTPNYLHAEMSIAAAEAGKHIICIKPIALKLEEANRMIKMANKKGVLLMYAENIMFVPSLVKVKQIVDEGKIGKVFRVKAYEGIPQPHASWFFDRTQMGGGCIIDMAVHSIAFCQWIAESKVERVYAEAGTFLHSMESEDTAVLTIKFSNGVIGHTEDSWSLVGAMDSRFEVFGTEGRIMVDNLYNHPIRMVTREQKGWSFPLPQGGEILDGHLAMLEYFVDCVVEGKKPCLTGENGRSILAVVKAAYKSLKTGRAETVEIS